MHLTRNVPIKISGAQCETIAGAWLSLRSPGSKDSPFVPNLFCSQPQGKKAFGMWLSESSLLVKIWIAKQEFQAVCSPSRGPSQMS